MHWIFRLAAERLLTDFEVPGISIAVRRDFQIEWAACGVADAETARPVTTETMFQAASISKPVAAVASLREVQNGFFTLDQDINTILTSWTLPYELYGRDKPVIAVLGERVQRGYGGTCTTTRSSAATARLR